MNDSSNLFEWSDPIGTPENGKKAFYEQHWQGMPAFEQQNKQATRQIVVSFDTDEAVEAFAKAIGQHLGPKTKSVWFPARERNNVSDLFWIAEDEDQEKGE